MGELERNHPAQLRFHHRGLLKAERIHEPVQVTGVVGRRQPVASRGLAIPPKPTQVQGSNAVFANQERHPPVLHTRTLDDAA